MSTSFHSSFIAKIIQHAKSETVLAQELKDLLNKSKASIYKKIKGEAHFTAEETLIVAKHYGISIDQLMHNGQSDFDKINFDYSLPQHLPHTPLQFIQKIRNDMERIAGLPQPSIRYASNEVPIFHSLMSRNVLAFKLYVWSRTNWKLPEMLKVKFNPDEIYALWPAIEQYRQEAFHFYQKIPSTEYWPRVILNNFLNQIHYYASINLFEDPKMPAILHNELIEMLDYVDQLALSGAKKPSEPAGKAATFEVYLNEIATSNNIILIYNETMPVSVYMTVDHPNFMRSTDAAFCARMHQWASQIEACSFSLANEQHRISLYGDLRGKIEAFGRV